MQSKFEFYNSKIGSLPTGVRLRMDLLLLVMTLLVFGGCYCRPQSRGLDSDRQAQTFNYKFHRSDDNGYEFSYSTTNGIERSEIGKIINKGTKDEHIEVQGYYRYIADDAKPYLTYYTAGKEGYKASTILDEKTIKDEFTDFIGTALLQTLSGGG